MNRESAGTAVRGPAFAALAKPFRHPLWLVGFRPFFILAFVSGAVLPVWWALVYEGAVGPPPAPVGILQWHAHEMFFGFGWAVMGGFLLTATKNWTKVRGYHGGALAFLAAAWVFERIGMAAGAHWPTLLFLLSNNLFLASIVAMLAWTLVRHRESDSFRDNGLFLVMLPAFIVAKQLILSPDHFRVGSVMALGLFRLAFLVMLERTVTQFMKSAFQVSILRDPRLDAAIKGLALPLVFAELLPDWLAAGTAAMLAGLLCMRLAFWKPQLAFRRLDIGIMYLGYIGIAIQLMLDAADRLAHPAWIGAVPVHAFTFGVMGLIIPAMLIRISNGHTGRRVVFGAADRAVLYMMMVGVVFRLVVPRIAPGNYPLWIALSAACWFGAFGVLAWRYVPVLLKPRVDGAEH